MVNNALTSPVLCWAEVSRGGRFRRLVPLRFMTAAQASTQAEPAKPKAEGRSPFVRLHELLADIKPGKPAINL